MPDPQHMTLDEYEARYPGIKAKILDGAKAMSLSRDYGFTHQNASRLVRMFRPVVPLDAEAFAADVAAGKTNAELATKHNITVQKARALRRKGKLPASEEVVWKQRAELCKPYFGTGLSDAKIAEATNLKGWMVKAVRDRANIAPQKGSRWTRPPLAKLVELRDKGMTYTQIGKELGVNAAVVARRLKRETQAAAEPKAES